MFPIVIAGIIALAVAVMGATITEIGPWYHGLVQPRWAPADAAYGVAWTAIYACTALAGVTGWLAMPRRSEREWLLGMFALNGFLNILWSLLFFRLHRPDWSLIEVVALWLSVAALIVIIWRRSIAGAATAAALSDVGDVRGLSQHDDRPAERAVFLNALAAGMRPLFASGHAVDIVLAVIAAELVWLVAARGWRAIDAVLRLAPGALMLLALRAALTGLDWYWIGVPLLLSFPVHLADLARPARPVTRPGG